jgi:hypothetical protein
MKEGGQLQLTFVEHKEDHCETFLRSDDDRPAGGWGQVRGVRGRGHPLQPSAVQEGTHLLHVLQGISPDYFRFRYAVGKSKTMKSN